MADYQRKAIAGGVFLLLGILFLAGFWVGAGEQENKITQLKNRIDKLEDANLGFRYYSWGRFQDGNIPTITETDIPNNYECYTIYSKAFDLNWMETIYLGVTIEKGEKFKQIKLDNDASILADLKNITSLNITMFCAAPELFLNNKLNSSYFYPEI